MDSPTQTGTETGITVQAATASQLVVFGYLTTTTAGVAHSFTVAAEDAFGNVAPTYVGTVTLTSSDSQATFAPATYSFAAGDAGTHLFTLGGTLKTVGSQSIIASDASHGFLANQGGITVIAAAASTSVRVRLPRDDGRSATVLPGLCPRPLRQCRHNLPRHSSR